ncbi:MAG: hypothetical protein B6D61_01045 [Bacteroidetes bacterium 4484_249]|nr:MAG: hypothetical protein B6D61_01045 [Bacteroidetes bacterium 4484_249]
MKPDFDELMQKWRKPGDKYSRNRLYVFLICLGFSIFIWFLVNLSKESVTFIEYPIVYSNVPKDLVLVNKPDTTLSFRVSSGGFELFTLKYLSRKKPIEIDLSNIHLTSDGEYFNAVIPTSQISENIIKRLSLSKEFISISPEKLYYKFEALSSKKVKVIPKLVLEFKKQFHLTDSLRASPDSVLIIGPKKVLNEIDFLETANEEFKNIDKSQTIKSAIALPDNASQIKVVPEEVEIYLSVEKFTESTIEVPVSCLDNNIKIKTFPDKIKITYLVALKDFKRVDESMFIAGVIIDKETTATKLNVEITHKPSFIKITKVEPKEVEFLVLK